MSGIRLTQLVGISDSESGNFVASATERDSMARSASVTSMDNGTWRVYLSGEIHSEWRERIADGVREAGLPVELLAPVTDHGASDDVGVDILGPEQEGFWKDHKGAGVNAVRTQTLLRRADVVVVRFGDKYRQWNAAFDAGFAAALGKPIVTLHDGELDHALKEVDRAAQATARTPEQVIDVLRYVIRGELPAG